MNRREFLRWTVLLASGLAAHPSNVQATEERPAPPPRAAKKVVVAGAGLAGLAAGYGLLQAGHDVLILEARTRAGGRVLTVREPFPDGLYAEAGPRFIPNTHHLTLQYVKLFNLPLDLSAPPAAGKLYYVRGRRITASHARNEAWPLDLTPEEKRLGRSGMLQRYIGSALKDLGDVTAPGWPSDPRLEKYDRMSAAEFLASQGASPGALALLRLGDLDLSGDGIESYSALFLLRNLALRQTETQAYAVRGGHDLLPKAFASRMATRIRYGAPVVRIEPGETSASVVIAHAGEYERLTADYVICALPFSVLRRIEISPSFSPQKAAAIDQLAYTSVARVYLQARRKFWLDEHLPPFVTSDLPIMWVSEATVNQPGPRGILEAYAAGAAARRITALKESDRISFALEQMGKIYPSVRQNFEGGASKCWDEDPWAVGAYVYFRPGQIQSLLPHIARPEGRVHFAGDHTSPWSGWMQGALESGLRVAREISSA